MRQPDFSNLLDVLQRRKPKRPTLFEFFLNQRLYDRLGGVNTETDAFAPTRQVIRAYTAAGYDYITIFGSDFHFEYGAHTMGGKSFSLNEGAVITDRASFEKYPWPDPDACDYSRLETLKKELPDGMKFIVYGPNGILENVILLVGHETLCLMILEDPELAADIFEAVSSRLIRYYEISAQYDSVGALISNDDWGFRQQTVFSHEDMRRYVFSGHKRIVEKIHAAGKPAILHSCGQLTPVMDDIIDDIKFDGKHSYEDNILPVEEAYDRFHDRIAILGGIDVNFLCNATPEAIRARAKAMLERSAKDGAYALGSGNSIPDYIPDEAYLAMISAAVE